MSTSKLDLDRLTRAVAGGVAAIRARSRLQSAGGPGDKVFPPTYATGDRVLKYATETRRVEGADVQCVLLDSVASQANRMEESLLEAWRSHGLPFPVVSVDFRGLEGVSDLDRISTLQAPHRIFDALLRDAMVGDVLFRDTPLGRAVTEATVGAATPLYVACPTALLFGAWDSTGPKGGLGMKIQRALVSEIVAVGAVPGVKTASRLDPAGILAGVEVYAKAGDSTDWTTDPAQAATEKGKPQLFARKGEGKGRPSAINHSNIAPSVDEFGGGITFDYALQTTVLSLPALRRVRFLTDASGAPLGDDRRASAELAARTALAALGLASIAAHRAVGYDLRSRCALVPEGPLSLELVPSEGGPSTTVALDASGAFELLREAHQAATQRGLGWDREPIRLVPAPKLVELIRRSRALASRGGDEEGGAA